MTALSRDFPNSESEYEALRKQCEAQVKTWRWATGPMLILDNVYPERYHDSNRKRFEWLEKPPKSGDGQLHGLDDQERIVLRRTSAKCKPPFHETLFLYGKNSIRAAFYFHSDMKHAPPKIKKFQELRLEKDRPATFESYEGPDGYHVTEKYEYLEDKVVRIHIDWKCLDEGKMLWSQPHRLEVTYDELGQLERVEDHYLPGIDVPFHMKSNVKILFQRREKGETIATVSKLVEDRLVEQIPKVVAGLKIKRPVFSIVLGYYAENWFPPSLGLGLESERAAWIEKHGKDVADILWNPEEYKHSYELGEMLKDTECLKACVVLNDLITEKERWSTPAAILRKVAASLTHRDWSKELQVTPDFVVVAADVEDPSESRKNFKASVSPDLLAQMKAKRWI